MGIGSMRSSLSIATETTFGSLDANGLPDVSALTFAAQEVSRDSITYDGQTQPVVMRDIAHAGMGDFPPEPATVYSAGAPIERRTAEITLRLPGVRCPGAAVTVDSLALPRMLQTVMVRNACAAGLDDVVAAGVPTVNTFDATNAGRFAAGYKIAFTINNRIEYAWVTDVSGGGVVTYSPATSAAPAVGSVVRICQTYVPTLGSLGMLAHPSLAIRQDMHDRRYIAVGCRLKTLTLTMEGANSGAGGSARLIVPTVKLYSPWVQDADGSAAPGTPALPSGPYAKSIQSYDTYSSLVAVSSPATAGRNAMETRRWSVEIDFDLVSQDRSDSGLTMSGYHCNGVSVTARSTFTPSSTLAAALNAAEMYHLMFGAGPTSAGADGEGLGFAFGMKSAFIGEYLKPVVSRRETLHEAVWSMGNYSYETGTWSPGLHADAPFTLGWVA